MLDCESDNIWEIPFDDSLSTHGSKMNRTAQEHTLNMD